MGVVSPQYCLFNCSFPHKTPKAMNSFKSPEWLGEKYEGRDGIYVFSHIVSKAVVGEKLYCYVLVSPAILKPSYSESRQ